MADLTLDAAEEFQALANRQILILRTLSAKNYGLGPVGIIFQPTNDLLGAYRKELEAERAFITDRIRELGCDPMSVIARFSREHSSDD